MSLLQGISPHFSVGMLVYQTHKQIESKCSVIITKSDKLIIKDTKYFFRFLFPAKKIINCKIYDGIFYMPFHFNFER